MDLNTKLYQDFMKLYNQAHTDKTPKSNQIAANEVWRSVIKENKNKVNSEKYKEETEKLKSKVKRKQSSGIFSFVKAKSSSVFAASISNSAVSGGSNVAASGEPTNEVVEVPIDDSEKDVEPVVSSPPTITKKVQSKPSQEKLKLQIDQANKTLVNLIECKNLGLAGSSANFAKQIDDTKKQKEGFERQLKRKLTDQKASQKFRDKKRSEDIRLKEDFPELATKITVRESVGRPRIECDQPGILEDILKIATVGSAAADRRRDNVVRTVKTVNDLTEAVRGLGYNISRSGVYLRLEPRDRTTIEGKRHVVTVPVRLVKPQNNLRKGHPDRMFAKESCKALDEIASYFGPAGALFLSQDDKSSVPLGVIAAKKQSSILMNMQYRVRLPDHDFKMGVKHLLTPSVIAVCHIDPKLGVSYSGETLVAVRSAKHNGSTSYSHYEDLLRLKELEPALFTIPGSVTETKPVIIKSVDGGPDENPRFNNNIVMACNTLVSFGLDMYAEVTNAPGLSAYNRAERRMHPLSLALTGVVLPYDTFGTHVVNGKTVDVELEKQNFDAAGEVLAEIFGNVVIDGFKVHSEYVKQPVLESTKNYEVSPLFRSRHVLETQYMTICMKCDDPSCCPPFRTNIEVFFPHRRIPPLIPIRKTALGPVALELSKDIHKKDIEFLPIFARIATEKHLLSEELTNKFKKVPYDCFFPTLQDQDKLQKRICNICQKYHSSQKSLKIHKKVCNKKNPLVFEDDSTDEDSDADISFVDTDDNNNTERDSEDDEELSEEPGSVISVSYTATFDKIVDLKAWLKSPWKPIKD